MERRTFVQGAFGLAVLAAMGAVGAGATGAVRQDAAFVTTETTSPEAARGPAMASGIELVQAQDQVQGWHGNTHLFDVDPIGAELVRMADGSLTIEELASATSTELAAADVASFFVALGQSGYLANTVLVNLTETVA